LAGTQEVTLIELIENLLRCTVIINEYFAAKQESDIADVTLNQAVRLSTPPLFFNYDICS
jgi:hypothetical protein